MGSCCKKSKRKYQTINDKEIINITYEEKLVPESMRNSRASESVLTINCSLQDFQKLKVLGKGSFGKVVLVRNLISNQLFAMKILKKKFIIQKNQIDHTKTERKLLEKLDNPFIVKLYYAFQDKQKLYFITDFMQGGELFFHLRRNPRYQDPDVIFYSSELLCAIDYMHSNNFIYRDLKPENVLIDNEGHIKLTDFGLSKILEKQRDKTYTLCGTAEYLAPEILFNRGYNKTCDWFSFGVLIFEMLCGFHPFPQKSNQIDMKIYMKSVTMPKLLSNKAKDLLGKLLESNPKKRLGYNGTEEIMKHEYFKNVDFEKIKRREYPPPFVPQLKGPEDLKYFDIGFICETVESLPNNKIESVVNNNEFEGFSFQPNFGHLNDKAE